MPADVKFTNFTFDISIKRFLWLHFIFICIVKCDERDFSQGILRNSSVSTHKSMKNEDTFQRANPDSDRNLLVDLVLDVGVKSNLSDTNSRIGFSPTTDSPDLTTSKVPAEVIKPSCQIYLDFFSRSVGEFMRCSISHARPLRFCGKCVNEYAAVVNDYDAIIMDETEDMAGRKCRDTILNADRIQIIVQIKNFITNLWSQGHCSACFDVVTVNQTKEYKKTAEVSKFEDLSNSTLHCMVNVSGGIIIPSQPYKIFNFSNEREVCQMCAPFYQELNNLYLHMEDETKEQVCMDIVDSMNYTRLLWSRDFQCSYKDKEIIPVLLLTFFFCILPIIFYVGTKVHGVKQEKIILQQKRLQNMTSNNSGCTGESEDQSG